MNDPAIDICKRIAQVRLELAGPRGKASFSKLLDLSPSTYEYYEGGRVPPADILIRIAQVAHVDLRWLMTGQSDGLVAVGADHPVLAAAAQLLARHSNTAAPLAAFIDILWQVAAKFPAKAPAGLAEPDAARSPGARAMAPSVAGDDRRDPNGSPREPLAGRAIEPAALPGPPQDLEQAQRSWIPVLGRSAAGIAQFWLHADDERGVTTVGHLVADHIRRGAAQASGAMAVGDAKDPSTTVQIISLTAPDAREVAEYVSAGELKSQYPDAFAVRIDGESMSPEILHGDLVVLSPSVPAADGKAAVVQLKQQIGLTCKLYRREGQTVHLVPIREDLPPQAFPAEWVVWALRVLARVRPQPRRNSP